MLLKETREKLIPTLKTFFGFDSFREQQQEIIESVLLKKDNVVIMPTGGGKSICFQLPALLFEGVTLVISPLIALMKDQVDGLNANGISADFYNSSQENFEQEEVFEKIFKKELKLLYVAPESLSLLQHILTEEHISCIAIDEAHCISSWGHDFRPSYQQLGFLKNQLPNTPIIALTATADKATRKDITQQLNIPEARQFVASFDRKNIELEVRPGNDRFSQILKFIKSKPTEAGIIYCLSRKSTEQLASKLKQNGIKAASYHAGLNFEERTKTQEDFIYDRLTVICATIAFGMGIDKSNVRWIIHYNMPKNIEGYYQEIGRCGRDGLKANALLFYSYSDVIQLRKFATGASNEDVQIAKLERMKQFSEATTCRRKILLSYFGELLAENCGNCDVCKNPPHFFDGTIIAQKALSVIARLKESEAIGTVIDVLRGAQNATIIDKQYHTLKSHGIGKDISWRDWQQYIIQLINQGYCEIAFHKNNALRLTSFSKKVLFENEVVNLTRPKAYEEQVQIQKKATIKITKKLQKDSLFERLRKLRQEIALAENIPAYLVFSDASLKEMERARPMCESDFLDISGVGQRKLEVYGEDFITEIVAFSNEKIEKRKKNDTHKITYQLYKEGFTIDEISEKRNLKPTTIFSHLAKLYTDGKEVDMYSFVTKEEVEKVRIAKDELESPQALKPYFEYFNAEIDYFKIRLALTMIAKEG
ncbi:MAG: DNA helicase RecQ [Lutibacter sp.]|uniref:DNA helicase RecQ n=1 Tax=Lutibacter sp. TaxID=1925666 RepID=UPI001790F5B5|nr:DNA helicase RecQ [Lutibacter sp.]MBT8318272.1 DNA helicase RecQ [Lutibacter sp.]NNJ59129.1 DNA helicase RecQ [Lutibacter sp.]